MDYCESAACFARWCLSIQPHRHACAEPLCRDFWSDVALRIAQQFESNHAFANRRRGQQRWIEVSMEMPFVVWNSIAGGLMKSHRVGKCHIEDFVIIGRKLL